MDPQLQQRLMLFAGFIPGGIAFALLLVAWYLHALRASKTDLDDRDENREPTSGPRWLLPILLLLGVVGADYAINDTFQLWPDSNNDRLPHAAALLALAALIEGLVKLPLLLGALLRAVAYAGVFWMLSEGYADTVLGGSGNLIAYTLFAALYASLIATAADTSTQHNNPHQRLGWVDAACWILILAAVMPVFLKNNYAQGGMFPAGLISVLTSTLIVGLIFRAFSLARGGITFIVGFILMMLTGTIVQAGVNTLPAVLLAATLPLVMLIPLSTPSGINRLLARAVLIAAVGGLAALLAFSPQLSFWPGNTQSDQQPTDATQDGQPAEQSLEDYYKDLE